MRFESMPAFVRNASVLTDEDRLKLASVAMLPDEESVDAIRTLPEIRDLLQAFIGDESTRNTHLQLKAKTFLDQNDPVMAWKVLLL
ncbi:hypothetical protein [Sphingobacterium deserti]|uniref:Flavin reductase domain-containing protein FMN-binding n=1 Tax=Sphingobacterium deserti TaxID=1229276 RepID=A0A0B8T5Q4_9SPHI|nr:hypothetical protein [Sphingobacterium deserti]KGE16033.1 flavin reductase domain-containing protein FMN-binding [Sphingobacterium deserti]